MSISFDSVTSTASTGSISSKTFAHTCSGVDRVLWVVAGVATSNDVSGVTYAGVPMLQFGSDKTDGTSNRLTIWYLVNPMAGSNNVVITATSTGTIGYGAISFTGVSQDTFLDGGNRNETTTSSFSLSSTSTDTNTYAVMFGFAGSGSALTGGSNTTIASQPEVTYHGTFIARSTAPISSAGSVPITVTSASQFYVGIMAVMRPAVPQMTTLFTENWNGSSIDTSRWKVTSGSVTVSGNSISGTAYTLVTEDSVHFIAKETTIIEWSTISSASSDSAMLLYDVSNSANYIGFYCNENYYSQGIRIDFGGAFGSGYSNTGGAVTSRQYYRVTLQDTTVRIQQGSSYGVYDRVLTRTASVTTTGKSFYIYVGANPNTGNYFYPITVKGGVGAGIKAYYKLDEASGNASDSSGNGYTLTNTGSVAYTAGKINNGASFTGTNSVYLSTANAVGFVTGGYRSISLSVKFSSTTGGYVYANATTTGNIYNILYIASGTLKMFANGNEVSSLSTLSTGVFYNVVMTQNGTTWSLYIDGVLQGSVVQGTLSYAFNMLRLGADNSGTSPSTCIVDEVNIYDLVVTHNVIQELHNNGKATQLPFIDTQLWGNLAYYKLDETSGNATDATGKGYTLTNNNVTYATGKINNGAFYDQTSNEALYTTNYTPFNFDRTTPFSFSCWVKRTSNNTSNQMIFSHANYGGTWVGYSLMINTLSGLEKLQLNMTNTSTAGIVMVTTNGLDTNWNHIVVTYDGSSSYLGVKIYINGVSETLVNTGTTLTGTIQNTEMFQIGSWGNTYQEGRFQGTIDEFGVWNRALSDTDVIALDNSAAGKQYPYLAVVPFTAQKNRLLLMSTRRASFY